MKFGRIYELTIEMDPGQQVAIIIRPPLTLHLNVIRNTLASVNTANFTIYNLSEKVRRQIYQDRYDMANYRRIVMKAGYEDYNAIIFRGQIRQAYSQRVGTEWQTNIEAWDGGDAVVNGMTARTIPAETQRKDVFKALLSDMPNLAGYVVGDFTDTTSRGQAIAGNTWGALGNMLSDEEHAFIDSERAVVKKYDEYLEGGVPLINADTGLLETPKRQDLRLDIKTLLEPRVIVGQVVELQSREKVYNGQYQVIGFNHTGTISGAVAGEATTTMMLNLGTRTLRLITQ